MTMMSVSQTARVPQVRNWARGQKPTLSLIAILMAFLLSPAAWSEGKPNVLVIWGDDVGWFNLSAYNHGLMGYRTPGIDRLAKDGALFTDWYGQQNSTAGFATFLTGQSPYRTGLLKPAEDDAAQSLSAKDPTIASLLADRGYLTGHFGKSDLGSRDRDLPSSHGFDEFFGHVNHFDLRRAGTEADHSFRPRGVLRATAVGRIQDTGALNAKRLQTINEELASAAVAFMQRAAADDQPFFLWFNATRVPATSDAKEGGDAFAAGLVEHDGQVAMLLEQLDEMDLADNTIVVYSSDNGADTHRWPNGGMTPFNSDRSSNRDGAFRVPMLIRWPEVITPGSVHNEPFSHEDLLPTILAAAGDPNIKQQLLDGHRIDGQKFKAHLDGYNLMPFLKGDDEASPREEFFFWTEDGELASLRLDRWKFVFMDQWSHGFEAWQAPTVNLRVPKVIDLRADPFERAESQAGAYEGFWQARTGQIPAAVDFVARHLQTYEDFPSRFAADDARLSKMLEALQANRDAP